MNAMRKRIPVLLLPLLAAVAVASVGAGETKESLGGRVGWGRLIMESNIWNAHSDRDHGLADFIRKQTTLNIDPHWRGVHPGRLEDLCTVPLIYVKDLSFVHNQTHLKNIAQYVQRGGFLCIDACATPSVTPDLDAYYQKNRDLLEKLIPGAEVRLLPEDHAIYHCYFDIRRDEILTPDMTSRQKWKHDGLHGVFLGERMLGIISMDGLECGWPERPHRVQGCMKLIVNIYIYAMTR